MFRTKVVVIIWILVVFIAGYFGQERIAEYRVISSESLNRTISNERVEAWESGYREGEKAVFNQYAEIAADIHGFAYKPDAMVPPRKPTQGEDYE